MKDIITSSLKDYGKEEQIALITKATEIFPEERRITINDEVIKNLIERNKAKIHYLGELNSENKNFIFQLTGQSINDKKIGKIMLGNLGNFKKYFENLDETVKKLSEEQLKYYNTLIIESGEKEKRFNNSVKKFFEKITNKTDIEELLHKFIPEKDYKLKKLTFHNDGSYTRKAGLYGDIEIRKNMYIKNN